MTKAGKLPTAPKLTEPQEVALYTRHARVQTLLDHYFDVVVDVGGKVAARVAAHV